MFALLALHSLSYALSPEQEVMKATTDYVEAVRTYNIQKMGTYFHPAYLEVSPRGQVEEKAAIFKSFDLPEEKRFMATRVDLTEWKIAFPRKDFASATFKQTYLFLRNEKEFKINVRVSATWIKERRSWVMTLQQSTILDAPPTRPATL